MYVVTTNEGVNSQNLGTSGLPVAIFKMSAAENDDKPKQDCLYFGCFSLDLDNFPLDNFEGDKTQ